jgi:hypothetical protein
VKRLLTGAVAAMVLGGLALSPVHAQDAAEPVEIPATVQIDDPVGDANGLNDQGNRADTGFEGDHVTPADAGSVSDIMKVWFTHDAENVSVNIQTEVPAPASTAVFYNVYASPNEDWPLGCLRFAGLIPGEYQGQTTTYQGDPLIKLVDRCNDEGTSVYNNGIEGTHVIAPGPDETGVLTLTFPRSYSPLLLDGLSIAKPFVQTATTFGEGSTVGAFSPIILDNTIDGTDYVLAAAEEPAPVKPPVKKGCKKGSPKAKKKGCRKP